MRRTRADQLNSLNGIDHYPSRLFFMTPETQDAVADIVEKRTGIRKQIVDAVLRDTGYASQRIKMDAVVAGSVLEKGEESRVLTLDDDTVIRSKYGVVKEGYLPEGLSRRPNSQVLLPDEAIVNEIFDFRENRIRPFFEHLGRTVGDLRRLWPGMRATEMQKDTMHSMLERVLDKQPAQFEVTHDDTDDIPDSQNARVIAAAATKYGIPDYRTVRIARANFEKDLPKEEVPFQSRLSGYNEAFAFRKSDTNVDSAALSRLFDGKTALMPWWFVSSEQISKKNPLRTVYSHYRADNELLPVLLDVASKSKGEPLVYLSGLSAQVQHNRSRAGYRPNLHEQAVASLVGNVAALEAAERLKIDPSTGVAALEPVDDDYKVPEEKAADVFHQMCDLADICNKKAEFLMFTKDSFGEDGPSSECVDELFASYVGIYAGLKMKTADFNFDVFYKHLNTEIRDQLRFYGEVLEEFSKVVDEVRKLIADGQYPIEEYVDESASSTVYMPGDNPQSGIKGLTRNVA